jgi:glycosyltransferase involved in cell wall biosynthesis
MTMANKNSDKKVRIAYLSVNDPLDRRSWSGVAYYVGQTLQRNIGEVDFLGPVKFPAWLELMLRAMAKLNRILFKEEYYTKYSLFQSWYASRWLKRKMKGREYDFIFSPASSPVLGMFKTDLPVIHYHDATFHLLSNYYKEFEKASRFTKWEGEWLERRALEKSTFVIYSSQWAAQSAIRDYQLPADRLCVIPFGANMDHMPSPGDSIFEKLKNPVLTLLYLAVEWERKGGSIAFDTLVYLRESCGIEARLIVCGCVPPEQFHHPCMEVIPFLNKNLAEDNGRFISLLSSSHFLILPTRADCSLLVACESNAYGVPAITTRTGGVPGIVYDGVNGYCLSPEAGGAEYGRLIKEVYTDETRYRALIASSRKRFEDDLNWDKWAERFAELYPGVLKRFQERRII